MNTFKKFALPLLVAGTIGMSVAPVQADPTIIPHQVAQVYSNPSERGDDNTVNDRPGMDSFDDNVAGAADQNDAEPSTFDATFWVLMALLAVGIVAMLIAATRRRATVH